MLYLHTDSNWSLVQGSSSTTEPVLTCQSLELNTALFRLLLSSLSVSHSVCPTFVPKALDTSLRNSFIRPDWRLWRACVGRIPMIQVSLRSLRLLMHRCASRPRTWHLSLIGPSSRRHKGTPIIGNGSGCL